MEQATLAPGATPEDLRLVEALKARDEAAFAELIERYGRTMLSVARMFVRDRAVAEEVVQEAWLNVLRGIDRFEGRSSLKTWILRILTNTAKTRGTRERRTVPFSAITDDEAAVDPARFLDEGRWLGHWAAPVSAWQLPEGRLIAAEELAVIERAIADLPPLQASVVTMRDVIGCDSTEVCNVLELSESNQRVLLHRGRSKVRHALEEYFGR
jgi:RNA polymerase sigma-70 factor (ECF subfamily)